MAWNPARSVLVTSVAMVSPCLALFLPPFGCRHPPQTRSFPYLSGRGVGGHRGKVLAYDTLLKYFMDAGHSMPAALKKLTAYHKSSPAAESGLGHTFGQYTRFHAPFSTSR